MDNRNAVVAELVGRPMVGKYLIITEAYNSEGESSLIVQQSAGLSIWDELGLLQSAINRANVIDSNGWIDGYNDVDEY